jgi:hypothetical protein
MLSIHIPYTVLVIGDSAFYGCVNLKSIKIPDGVTDIGKDVFYNCYKQASGLQSSGVNGTQVNVYHGDSSNQETDGVMLRVCMRANGYKLRGGSTRWRASFSRCTRRHGTTPPSTTDHRLRVLRRGQRLRAEC